MDGMYWAITKRASFLMFRSSLPLTSLSPGGNNPSGLAGVGAGNMNQSQQPSPRVRIVPTIDDTAPTLNDKHEGSHGPGSSANLEWKGQSAWSISPESTYDAEINIASRSKISSPQIVNISSVAVTSPPTNYYNSISPSGNTASHFEEVEWLCLWPLSFFPTVQL